MIQVDAVLRTAALYWPRPHQLCFIHSERRRGPNLRNHLSPSGLKLCICMSRIVIRSADQTLRSLFNGLNYDLNDHTTTTGFDVVVRHISDLTGLSREKILKSSLGDSQTPRELLESLHVVCPRLTDFYRRGVSSFIRAQTARPQGPSRTAGAQVLSALLLRDEAYRSFSSKQPHLTNAVQVAGGRESHGSPTLYSAMNPTAGAGRAIGPYQIVLSSHFAKLNVDTATVRRTTETGLYNAALKDSVASLLYATLTQAYDVNDIGDLTVTEAFVAFLIPQTAFWISSLVHIESLRLGLRITRRVDVAHKEEVQRKIRDFDVTRDAYMPAFMVPALVLSYWKPQALVDFVRLTGNFPATNIRKHVTRLKGHRSELASVSQTLADLNIT